ncbi:MAG: hypothetical protein U5K71_11760 [Gracilimonas sp.]|nr:hypothetical protein [Gracilimonas sp.]
MERETKLFFGGMILAALGFFIPLYFGKIWLGLFLAILIAVIFLGRLLSLSEKEFESKVAYRIVYGLVVLVVLFHAIAFAHDYGRKDYQKDLLLEIRKTIDSGITQADVREKLIYVLGQYHQNDRESIVATFRDQMPEHLGDDGVYLSDFDLRKAGGDSSMANIDDDHINHFYEIDAEADEIKVIVVTDISLGSDPEFENYDGQKGRFEMVFTLNEEGVSYEVLN